MKLFLLKHRFLIGLTLILFFFIITAYYIKNGTVNVFSPTAKNYRTVIIDAGHGGMDGGASGESGSLEKIINFEISKKTEIIMKLYGINTLMTREGDCSLDYSTGRSIRENKVSDLKARLEIVKNTVNPVLLSIHLNKFTQSENYGAQVFYSKNNLESQVLARALQDKMKKVLDERNKRDIKEIPDSIYIMRNAECPAVTIECGFLSNPREEHLLQTSDYQNLVAISILGGYMDFEQNPEKNGGDISLNKGNDN